MAVRRAEVRHMTAFGLIEKTVHGQCPLVEGASPTQDPDCGVLSKMSDEFVSKERSIGPVVRNLQENLEPVCKGSN